VRVFDLCDLKLFCLEMNCNSSGSDPSLNERRLFFPVKPTAKSLWLVKHMFAVSLDLLLTKKTKECDESFFGVPCWLLCKVFYFLCIIL